MRRMAGIVLAALLFACIMYAFTFVKTYDYNSSDYYYTDPIEGGKVNETVTGHYIENTKNETGAINAVTAIVVEYRGFDTLGEVTVLFTAFTGVSMLLYSLHQRRKRREANLILKEGSKIVLPFILLTGAYIFIHGHLTPGGGFPGGSVIASGFLLMMVAYPKYFLKESRVSITESVAGMIFVLIGMLGLVFASYFLENFLSLGDVGRLFSAGIIPIIYIAIGFKVGAELSGIMNNLKGVEE